MDAEELRADLAGVTLRIWIPLLIIAHDGQFLPAYRWVAWLSWVPNALFVEWIIRRGWKPSYTHDRL